MVTTTMAASSIPWADERLTRSDTDPEPQAADQPTPDEWRRFVAGGTRRRMVWQTEPGA